MSAKFIVIEGLDGSGKAIFPTFAIIFNIF